jgi:RNA polymerase sigma-70 factor (ECF subfamily)
MDDPAASLTRLLTEARAGSREALGQLLETYRRYLLMVARRKLNADLRSKAGASDIVQQTFLEAQRDFGGFRGVTEAELLGWLRQILLNNLASFSRGFRETAKRKPAHEISLEVCAALVSEGGPTDATPAPLDEAITRERIEALRRALAGLPDDYCQVLLLRHQEGLSYEEIGRVLQRTPNATRKLWHRALERLQKEMEPPAGGQP